MSAILYFVLQVSILKWLILVYDLIDDKDTVHSLYGILFPFLDNDALVIYFPPLCQPEI